MKRNNFFSKVGVAESSVTTLAIPKDIEQLRILHSSLISMEGVSVFRLKVLNLSSNRIEHIHGIELMKSLEQINLSNNKIREITCLDTLTSLEKLNLFNNEIESLEGLRRLSNNSNNRLKALDMRSNHISSQRDFEVLTGFGSLEEVTFDIGKATNPVCENRIEYHRTLMKHLRPSVKRIDNREYREVEQSLLEPSKSSEERENKDISNAHDTRNMGETKNMGYEVTRVQLMELEKIISFKDLILEEMKTKNLEMTTQMNQRYKDLIKTEHDLARSEAQNEELEKRARKKDKQLLELQSTLNDMMRENGKLSKEVSSKNTEMERFIRESSELKLENAESRAVIKDNERKISDFHARTLDNVNNNSAKMEDLKKRYEKLYSEHSALQSQAHGLKLRVQQLNEICREWEFKFQRAHDEYLHSIEKELRSLQQEHDKKAATQEHAHKQEANSRHLKYKEQLDSVENSYKEALTDVGEKYKKVKRELEDLTKGDVETRNNLRFTQARNSELEAIVDQSRQALEKFRHEFMGLLMQKEAATKELQQLRVYGQEEVKQLTKDKERVDNEKTYLERELLATKDRMMELQVQLDRGGKMEELNTAIDIKNQMLEDKNETIETLKEEMRMLKQSEGAARNQLEGLRKKYEKTKHTLHEQQEELQSTINEYQELKDRSEEMEAELQGLKEQLSSKEENQEKIEKYLGEFSESVREKDSQIGELLSSLEECRRVILHKTEERDIFKKEAENLKREFNEKYDFYRSRERDTKATLDSLTLKVEKLEKDKAESEKSKQAAKQNLQKLTKLLSN